MTKPTLADQLSYDLANEKTTVGLYVQIISESGKFNYSRRNSLEYTPLFTFFFFFYSQAAISVVIDSVEPFFFFLFHSLPIANGTFI